MNTKTAFEAVMRSRGHTNFSTTKTGKYVVASLQQRWVYFQLGWELAIANKGL